LVRIHRQRQKEEKREGEREEERDSSQQEILPCALQYGTRLLAMLFTSAILVYSEIFQDVGGT
jgi:hypothetical protein